VNYVPEAPVVPVLAVALLSNPKVEKRFVCGRSAYYRILEIRFGRRKMVEERRQHQRRVPNAPLFISLDDSKSGLLLDLCEGGLAVASLVPRNLDEVVSLAFDLPHGVGRVETQARIAWTRDAGHLTGVHFVDLDQDSQQQLTEWISAGANFTAAADQPAEPVFVTRSSYAQVDPILQESRDKASAVQPTTLFPATTEPEPEKSEPVEAGGRERGIKSRYTMELFLAVVLLSWALVFLGYQMGSTGASRQTREVTAAPKGTETPARADLASVGDLSTLAPASTIPPTPAAATARTPVRTAIQPSATPPASKPTSTPTLASKSILIPGTTSMDSGVVLQVGAMKLEDNASAMAQDLRKRRFPAVVFRHGNDTLYRVAVGPYSDADAMAKVKEQLEKQGFKPLRQRWARE
jgi:cell division septation protein DedD